MNAVPDHIIDHLAKDEVMAAIIKACNIDYRISKISVFEALIQSIVSQQLSTKAAATIYARFRSSINSEASVSAQIINMEIEDMRALGLSYQKARYIKNVTTFFDHHNLYDFEWEALPDEEIIARLTQIKGVGKWTVEMMLMFVLGREDVLPLDDLIIRTHIIKHYNITSQKHQLILDLKAVASPWQPYRSIACRYLWAAKDSVI